MQVLRTRTLAGGRHFRDGPRCIGEALDRISGAFAKLRIPDPQVQIQINLIPPSLEKDGTWLDLPLAIIMLQASGYLPDLAEHLEGDYVLAGEVGLHGEIRRVPGILSIAMKAKPGQKLIVPAGNEKECALILAKPGHEGCRIFPVSTLEEVIEYFKAGGSWKTPSRRGSSSTTTSPRRSTSASSGARSGRRRLRVSPPPAVTTCCSSVPQARGSRCSPARSPGSCPASRTHEKVELTRIYSAYGALDHDGVAVTRRPMRSIHHTASKQSLIGGGSRIPRPGEITLAHLGVLFLDEIAEFSSSTLEALRQPLEAGRSSSHGSGLA